MNIGKREQSYPLSPMQQGMLFHTIYAPESGVYLQQFIGSIQEKLHVGAFKQAWQRIVTRHAIFRTSFHWDGVGEARQHVHLKVRLPFDEQDWRHSSSIQQYHKFQEYLHTDRLRGVELQQAPLMRVALFRLADAHYRFVWTSHHLLMDGRARLLVLKEFFALYEAFSQGKRVHLKRPRPYRDFIEWIGQQNLAKGEEFWRCKLKGFTSPTPLPIGRAPKAAMTADLGFGTQTISLSKSITAALQGLATQHGLSLSTFFQGAWAFLLSRYNGMDTAVFGTTRAGRRLTVEGGDSLVGVCINTVPIRVDVPGHAKVLHWLQELRTQWLNLRPYEHTPLSQIHTWSEVPPREPLFESLLVFERMHVNTALKELGEAGRNWDCQLLQQTNYPLTVSGYGGPEFLVEFSYDRSRFEDATISRMMSHMETVLAGIADDSEQSLRDLSLLTSAEKHQLLVDWNATQQAYPQELCLHELFEAQVIRTPDAVAVVCGEEQLTYLELNARANQLAHYIRKHGVGPEVLVGICLERSPEMVIGMLGILKAGGAYVPLDPTYPQERLAFMLNDAQVAVLLTQNMLLEKLPEHDAKIVCLDIDWENLAHHNSNNPPMKVTASSLAYVIYTSGSTGRPKGVLITHHAICNHMHWMREAVPLTPEDRVLQRTPFNFDASVWEFFAPLHVGTQLVLSPSTENADTTALVKTITCHQVTVLQVVPSLLRLLLDDSLLGDCGSLRRVCCGGEPLPGDLQDRFLNRFAAEFYNFYGPTEATIDATYWKGVRDGPGHVSIGRPIANTQVYMLDGQLEPVPIGVTGELYIGGSSLARGYINGPELTAEKFVPHPFSKEAGTRLYRTGDLALYRGDGSIEFLGRRDHQVKIRGYRIELGEIETVLSQHSGVQEAVVLAREEKSGEKRLAAYVVAAPDSASSVENLQSFLKVRLPAYMMPAAFVRMEAFPLTPNGKVDLRALPHPDGSLTGLVQNFVPPRSPMEEALVQIWADILQLEHVGVHDNFFDLGGHSLLATQVISRVQDTFHVELPLRHLFEGPTVARLAEVIETARRMGQMHPASPLVPCSRADTLSLSFAQQRLWFLHQLEHESPAYNIPLTLRLFGNVNVAALHQSLQALVDRHESLRTCFPDVAGQPSQVITDTLSFPFTYRDLRELPEIDREVTAQDLVREEALRPFALATGPVIRGMLLQLAETDYILLVNMHHIISDGWSLGVVSRELAVLYDAFVNRQPSPLLPLPIQYVDFAHWQRQWFTGGVLDHQLSYWREHLADLIPLELPTDRPHPPVQTYTGARHLLELHNSLRDQLKLLSRQQGVTLAITLLAAFQVLLARYTGQSDIAVGSPIANRNRKEIEDLIGFFVNTLVMRTKLSGDPTFHEVLSRVQEMALGAYDHQDLPFARLVEELQPERNLSRNPLFQVAFAVQNAPTEAFSLPGVTVQPFDTGQATTRFDLECYVWERDTCLQVAIVYNTDLFDATTMERFSQYFQRVLEEVAYHPGQRLSQIPLLSLKEHQQLLVDWNATQTAYPREATLVERFEAQVGQTPHIVAVEYGEAQLTYAQLNASANQLAHHLQQYGIGPEQIVGVLMPRSPEFLIACVGILKAGGAFLPLDPSLPAERIAFMLEDAQASVVVTQTHTQQEMPETVQTVCIVDVVKSSGIPETSLVALTLSPANLAYVIYTSGSTGQPKGVQVTHANLLNLVYWHQHTFAVTAADRATQLAGLSFDATVWELWPYLLKGARVMLPDNEEVRMQPEQLRDWLIANQITVSYLPTPLAETVLTLQWPESVPLRTMLTGGDTLHQYPAPTVPFTLVNNYGPTENTVVTTSAFVLSTHQTSEITPSIGRPIDNVRVYVLDRAMQPVPVGVAGELHIGGDSVARGYLDRSTLTAEKFIPHSFSKKPGIRLYRTGDRVRHRADGAIEFLGRVDHQVKIRGYRIELGEIEAVLAKHSLVAETVAMVREDEPGAKRMVAYVVPDPEQAEALIHIEGETWAEQHITDWQTLYDQTYGEGVETTDSTFNINGWNSSYTGEPIPAVEMREWVDGTVDRIRALQPQRVLEIGCGTGLLLYRLAPQCTQYVATDFSEVAVQTLRHGLTAREDLAHVTLEHRMADDFSGIAPESFDTVILNSVTQYLPSLDYLAQVLEGSLNAVKPGGHIFVGDIRSLPLLTAFHASVQIHQADDSLSTKDLERQIQRARAQEEELVIAPNFFTALAQKLPRIGHVEVLLKRGQAHNELTRFRYDVIIHVEPAVESEDVVHWVDWTTAGFRLAYLPQWLQDHNPASVGITGIPNARLQTEVQTLAWLAQQTAPATVAEFREALAARLDEAVDPQELWEALAHLPYWCELGYTDKGAEGTMTAVLRQRSSARRPCLLPASPISHPRNTAWTRFGTNPLKTKMVKTLIPQLRTYLQTQVPDYMIPSSFVILDTLPLSPNGKVDWRALPVSDGSRGNLETSLVAPRTLTEQRLVEIWREVLTLEYVGIHDNFFELGGHSLSAVQVVARLRNLCHVELSVKCLFHAPTVAELAANLEEQLKHDQPPESMSSMDKDLIPLPGAFVGSSGQHPFDDWFKELPLGLTVEHRNLMSLIEDGAIPPVDSVALTYIPDQFLLETQLTRDEVIQGWYENQAWMVNVLETSLGRIGIVRLPCVGMELYTDQQEILGLIQSGLEIALHSGAKTVSLTGLLPSATNYGYAIQEAIAGRTDLPLITTGHATTAATVVLTVQKILAESGRELISEKVGFLGLGSIGIASLRLMLSCLPHPREILLCDVYLRREALEDLSQELVEVYGFHGIVRIVVSTGVVPDELYHSSLIIGATNVPEILHMEHVQSGTLIVDDSGPHCFSVDAAIDRFRTRQDILFTAGGVLQPPAPITCVRFIPPRAMRKVTPLLAGSLTRFHPLRIGGCVLSSLLLGKVPSQTPNLGIVDVKQGVENFDLLMQLGFEAADFHCENYELPLALIRSFAKRFGHSRSD